MGFFKNMGCSVIILNLKKIIGDYMVEKRQYKSSTLGVRAGQEPDPVTGACAVPIYQTSSYGYLRCCRSSKEVWITGIWSNLLQIN